MKTIFYNATLHSNGGRVVTGIVTEEMVHEVRVYKIETWNDFYSAVQDYIKYVNSTHDITMNQFSKLED